MKTVGLPRNLEAENEAAYTDLFSLSESSGATETASWQPCWRRTANGGDQPRLDGSTELLLLDEPSLGLAPLVIRDFDG